VELTAANHVHLVEPHWSPMAEAQAVDRVHRIGQIREVVVTRYIVSNTIEEVCLSSVGGWSSQSLVLMLQAAVLLDRSGKLTRTSTSNGFSRTNWDS